MTQGRTQPYQAKRTAGDHWRIRDLVPGDRSWVETLLTEHWGSPYVVSRGRLHDAATLPGFVAVRGSALLGLLTYRLADRQCEVVTLNSLEPGRGIGTALLAAARERARRAGAGRLWLITTNDNLTALAFYQKHGLVLVRLHPAAVAESRRLKPEIPLVGNNGIPIRDELELEEILDPTS